MNRSPVARSVLVLLLSASALAAALPADPPAAAQPAEGLAALRAEGPSAAVAICPVRVTGAPNRKVAEALGLVLEKFGMDHLEIAAEFDPPADVTWADVPAKLGEFVRKNPPAAAYVLYAEYLGEPKTGPTEVRFVVVDKAGATVLVDRQTPADADFKRTAGADPDPMGCSVCIGERLFKLAGWKKIERPGEGKFAKLWAEKSGTPDEGERKAMEQRIEKLKAGLAKATIGVFPPLVNDKPDVEAAAPLAKLIAAQCGCPASAIDRPLPIRIEPNSNEQKRLWDLARAFREQVRKQPPESEYVLQAEYLMVPGTQTVHSVHFVVCDRAGEWVVVDFQNNQHADFKRIDPKTVADCEKLTAERLRARLR